MVCPRCFGKLVEVTGVGQSRRVYVCPHGCGRFFGDSLEVVVGDSGGVRELNALCDEMEGEVDG